MSRRKAATPITRQRDRGQKVKPLASGSAVSVSHPERMARAVLDDHFPGGTLRHFDGDFYRWRAHVYTGGHFTKIPRRALSPFAYRTLERHGYPPTAPAIREVTLALSAITLVTERPMPGFDEALWAREGR